MTKAQQRIVEALKRDIIKYDGSELCPEKYEYKKWEVEERHLFEEYKFIKTRIFVYITSTVGLVGDEGTKASIFCRRHRLLRIGSKGGVKGLLGKKKSGYRQALIWSYKN